MDNRLANPCRDELPLHLFVIKHPAEAPNSHVRTDVHLNLRLRSDDNSSQQLVKLQSLKLREAIRVWEKYLQEGAESKDTFTL